MLCAHIILLVLVCTIIHTRPATSTKEKTKVLLPLPLPSLAEARAIYIRKLLGNPWPPDETNKRSISREREQFVHDIQPGGVQQAVSAIKCGTREQRYDPQLHVQSIIRGHDAPEKWWPWQVFIYLGGPGYCGGVLISNQWVLTAAHCIRPTSTIILGRVMNHQWTPFSEKRSAALHIIHPDYDGERKFSDIALIKMDRPVEFNGYVRPICLPKYESSFRHKECYVTGWGRTEPRQGTRADHLQMLQAEVEDQVECSFRWAMFGISIKYRHICLSFNETNRWAGICNGDSGGPLSCKVHGIFLVAGVAAFVERGCRKPFAPDVFTRVSVFEEWISKQIVEHA